MTVEVSMLIAVIGCGVGVFSMIRNRDKDNDQQAEWRGEVKGQLNGIQASVSGIRNDVDRIEKRQVEQGERLAKTESSAAQAHKRIDVLEKK